MAGGLAAAAVAAVVVLVAAAGIWHLTVLPVEVAAARASRPRAALPGVPAALVRFVEPLARRLAPVVTRAVPAAHVRRVDRRLDLAGRPAGATATLVVARQLALVVVVLPVAVLLGITLGPTVPPGLLLLSWLYPEVAVRAAGRRRQREIAAALPDLLDLLSITVEAGLGLRSALTRVAAGVGGPLGEEVLTTVRRWDLGVGRVQALAELRDRNDSVALGTFVVTVARAETLGSPLAPQLVRLAGEVRRDAVQTAKAAAARAQPRIAVVTSLVVMPGVLVVLIAGVAVRLGGLLDVLG